MGPTLLTNWPTDVSTVFNKRYCILLDCKIKQVVPIGEHLSIVAASIVDPYVLLQLHDGSSLLLQGDMTTKDVTILSQTSILNVSSWRLVIHITEYPRADPY